MARGGGPGGTQADRQEQVAAIIAGLKADDRKAVEAVLIAERAGHNREVVISAAEDAIKTMTVEGTRAPTEDGFKQPDDGQARPDPRTVLAELKAE
jgi:Glu-tRNA(Gln) amidotransferase subunit E-like FAD-binding protein